VCLSFWCCLVLLRSVRCLYVACNRSYLGVHFSSSTIAFPEEGKFKNHSSPITSPHALSVPFPGVASHADRREPTTRCR